METCSHAVCKRNVELLKAGRCGECAVFKAEQNPQKAAGEESNSTPLLARGERGPIGTMSGVFEMGSRKDGDDLTACGRAGINHRMRRYSPMKTACINPGCDAAC